MYGGSLIQRKEVDFAELGALTISKLSRERQKKVKNELEELEQMIDVVSGVGKNEILLGFETREFLDPVSIPLPKTSKCSLTLSQKGDGKSFLMWHIIHDEWKVKSGWYVVKIDPKQEYSYAYKPVNTEQEIELLRKAGKKPKRHKISYVAPEFANIPYFHGKSGKIGLSNISSLRDVSERVGIMAGLLGISQDEPAYRSLYNIISKGIPEKFIELDKLVKQDMQRQRMLRGGKTISAKLWFELERRKDMGILTDRDSEIIDFSSELVNTGNLFIEVPPEIGEDVYSQIFVSLALRDIYSSRVLYRRSGGMEGIVDRPVIVSIDEADLLIPRNRSNFASDIITKLFTKGRADGFSINLITQDPMKINSTVMKQMDWFFTTRVRDEAIKKLISSWAGVEATTVNTLLSYMDYDREHYPRQWAMFYSGADFKLFYPPYPSSQIAREQKFSLYPET